MAYNKNKIFKLALKSIADNNLFFIEDVVAYLPCDKTTFYRYFPPNSNEYNDIKSNLETNKIRTKSSIRHKLYTMDNPTSLIALYKMICSVEERNAINQVRADITTNGKEIVQEPITIEVIDRREQVEKE